MFIFFYLKTEMFSGAIFMQQMLGWNLYACVAIILVITGVYTVTGMCLWPSNDWYLFDHLTVSVCVE